MEIEKKKREKYMDRKERNQNKTFLNNLNNEENETALFTLTVQ